MTQFKDRRLLTTLLKESILQLCKISVGLIGNYEIDGIICISSSEIDDQHIVVKVHEQIVKDDLVNQVSQSRQPAGAQPDCHSEREHRKNPQKEMDWHSSTNNNHKRWMNSRQNEQNYTGRCVGGESASSRVGQCGTSLDQRVGSVSPDRQPGHDFMAPSGNAQPTRHSVYLDDRPLSSASLPPGLGIGRCSYPILSESQQQHLSVRTEVIKHGLNRKRMGSSEVNMGEGKRRMQCVRIDYSEEDEAGSLLPVCDDTEDIKHIVEAVGLSEMLDCGEVVIKKEADDCEADTSLSSSSVPSSVPLVHSAGATTCADYEVPSLQEASAVASSSDLVQPINTQNIPMSSHSSSQDTERRTPGEVADNIVLPSTGMNDACCVDTASKYLCAQCKSCLPSKGKLEEHFSDCHACAMTHCCDRCHQGFSEQQAYMIHACSNEQENFSDNGGAGNCEQVSTSMSNNVDSCRGGAGNCEQVSTSVSDDADTCQHPNPDNVAHNNSEHHQQTVDDSSAFVSDTRDSTNTVADVTSELLCGIAMQKGELQSTSAVTETDSKGLYATGDRSFVDNLSGSDSEYVRRVELNILNVTSGGVHASDYRCCVCQLPCYSYSALETHSLREHKRYTCPHCNKSFTQTSSRNRHMYTHDCRQPFGCLHCSARFTRADTLRKHYARQHNSTSIPAWLGMNMPPRNEVASTLERGQSLDSITLESPWPSGSMAVDVNRDMTGVQTYVTTALSGDVRSSAEMIEISDEGE